MSPLADLSLYFTLMGREAMYDMLPSLLSTNACRGEDGREDGLVTTSGRQKTEVLTDERCSYLKGLHELLLHH